MIRVLFVCLGNVCRSPMAEFVFKDLIEKEGMESMFVVDSAATSSYNEQVKEETDYRVLELLKREKIKTYKHVSRQIRKEDYDRFDYILGMEDRNVLDILKIVGEDKEGKVKRLLDYTTVPNNIADPWYTGDFDKAYYDILYGCTELLKYLKENGKI